MREYSINATPTYIGTSGYGYDDWIPIFYPEETKNREFLRYYIDNTKFNFVELNYTFYKVPEANRMENMLKDAKGDVKFSVKLTKNLLRQNIDTEILEGFKEGIKPLIEHNALLAVYADFHHSFHFNAHNLDMIRRLKDEFPDIQLFVELVNRTWYKERILDQLSEHNIGFVVIDMPKLPTFPHYMLTQTNNNLYFKLYGANPGWVVVGDKILDYDYNEQELQKFYNDAINKAVLANSIIFSFCNVANAKAIESGSKFINIVEANK